MTTAVRKILASFDRLKPTEKRDAAAEILRRAKAIDYPPLEDEDLAAIASELFLTLDREESDARAK